MFSIARALLLGLALQFFMGPSVLGQAPPDVPDETVQAAPEANPAALKAFAEMVKAYRERPALTIKSTVKVSMSQGEVQANPSEVKGEFTFGSHRRAVIKLRGFTCYLNNNGQNPSMPEQNGDKPYSGTISVIHEGTDQSFYSDSDEGSPYYALLNMFIDMPFPELAIELGEDDINDVLMQFHPKAINGLRPTAVKTEEKDGKTLQHITLADEAETIDIAVDPKTKLMQTLELRITAGDFTQQGTTVVYHHAFDYEIPDKPLDESAFTLDPGKRQRVDMITALMPKPVAPEPGAPGMPGEGPANALVGKPAPSIALTTADGKEFNLEKLRGRVVVLDFWASWCGPCMQALPMLHQVAKWAADEQLPVTVMTINVFEIHDPNGKPEDRLASAKATWAKKKFTLPIAMDYSDAIARAYGVSGIPTGVIIRSDGVIHALHVGGSETYVEDMKRDIQAAMKAVEAAEKPAQPEDKD